MYRFVLWLVPTVEKFPRRQKFLLGDRLQATALDVLERLVEATYTRDRRRHLLAANLGARPGARGPSPDGTGTAGRRMRRRRADDLFDRFATFEALCAAALRAMAGKRRVPGPAGFFANLEPEVLRLEERHHRHADCWKGQ